MKFKELGVPELVGTVVSCYEKLKGKLEKICNVESHFGIIGFRDGMMQSVSLKELGECDDLLPFCAQCAFVYKNTRYSIFYGLNNYSIINTFGRARNNICESVNDTFHTPFFRPKLMNVNLVEGYNDFMSIAQDIYSYGYIFNVMNINEFRLIDAHSITDCEHITRVFERIENFAELYYAQIMEAMTDDEFISELIKQQKEESALLSERKKVPNAVKLSLAFNSFCMGKYRDASKRFHKLEKILTQYENRRLNYIDSILHDEKQTPAVESELFNYVEKGKAILRNESKYVFLSILIASPMTFLISLLVFLVAKNAYFSLITKNKALLVVEPVVAFYFIFALLAGIILLFPSFKIVMKVFFKNKSKDDNINRQVDAYIRRARLWPIGVGRYFFNIMTILIFLGFTLLINNNLVFFRDRMVISGGSFRGISKQVIEYSDIKDIYKVTKVKRGDQIYDGWRLYYIRLKNNSVIRAENVFTSKKELVGKALPIIIDAIERVPIEVGLFEEIPR